MDDRTNINKESKAIKLEEKQIYSLKKPEKIFVTSGNLWITVEGDSEDYFFSEGDIFKIPNGKHAVIQALGKSSFWF